MEERERSVKKMSATDVGGRGEKVKSKPKHSQKDGRQVRKEIEAPPPPPPMYTYHVPPQEPKGAAKLIEGARNRQRQKGGKGEGGEEGKMVWGGKGRYG